MPEFDDTTLLIPLKIDSGERKDNLDRLLDYLSAFAGLKIILTEAGPARKYFLDNNYSNVTYFFCPDADPVFYRTYYINRMLEQAVTPVVGVWDTDVFVSREQFAEAVRQVRCGEAVLCYPYDGRFYCLSREQSVRFRQAIAAGSPWPEVGEEAPRWPDSVGGAFFADRRRYLEAGGENEYFYGWGEEDKERYRRLQTGGWPVTRVPGRLFHLYHPVGLNSRFANAETERRSRQELARVTGLSRREIGGYVAAWRNPETLFRAGVEYLMAGAPFCADPGLYAGMTGSILFFLHYARYAGQSFYEDFAGELLERLPRLLNDELPAGFGYGLSGIGWGMVYLVETGLLEGDLSDALSDLDERLMRYDPRRISGEGMEDGPEGILCYVLARLQGARKNGEPEPFDACYLAGWEEHASSAGGKSGPFAAAYLRYRQGGAPEIDNRAVLKNLLNKVLPDPDPDRWKPGLKDGYAGFILNRIGL